MALWQAISNESKTSSIWLVRVPSKPISHENGYHMHFLAQNNHKFKFHNKETHNWNITTSSTNHRVRYGIRSELCLTLQHNRGVREKIDKIFIFQVHFTHNRYRYTYIYIYTYNHPYTYAWLRDHWYKKIYITLYCVETVEMGGAE